MWRKFKAVLLATSLAATLTGAASAHDDEYQGHDRGRNRAQNAREYGFDNGYRDGFHHGREDRIRRIGYNYRHGEYKRGLRGYERWMGSQGQYKKGYRDGYKRGYDDAYRGRRSRHGDIWAGYPRDGRGGVIWDRDRDGDIDYRDGGWGRYGSPAYSTGFQDGVERGTRDRQTGHSYRPTQHGAYRDADHGYDSRYGDRDTYKQQYREGFLQGYRQGYGR